MVERVGVGEQESSTLSSRSIRVARILARTGRVAVLGASLALAAASGCGDDDGGGAVDGSPGDGPVADAAQPDAAQPDAMQPDAMQPDAMQPDAMQPDAMQPDAMQPDAAQPDAMQPDAMQPDATPGDGGSTSCTWTHDTTLTGMDTTSGDYFGQSVSLSGTNLVVGAMGHNGFAGAVYVFERTGGLWLQSAKLEATDPPLVKRLGTSVAVDGATLLAGAPPDDAPANNSGSVYVYDLVGGTWMQAVKLTASDGELNDRLGESVALSGDIAVAGAPYEDASGPSAGAAYVFERVAGTWTETAKLVGMDTVGGDFFGFRVAVHGGRVVVGAPYHGLGGAAYVFEKNAGAWTQTAKLSSADGDEFGTGVAVFGDRIAVGAPVSPDGSVRLYDYIAGAWQPGDVLGPVAAPGIGYDAFGQSVALSGDSVAVGATEYLTKDPDGPGSVYFFDVSVSPPAGAEPVPSAMVPGDFFGWSVAMDGDLAAGGAPYASGPAATTGVIHAFACTPPSP